MNKTWVIVVSFIIACIALSGAWTFLYFSSSDSIGDNHSLEEKIIVYGALQEPVMKQIIELFEQQYPTVEVEYWRASSSGVFNRVLSEVKSGDPHFDIVLGSPHRLNILKNEGAFQKYYPSNADLYPQEFHFDPDGVITPSFSTQVIAIIYNTELVEKEEAPQNLIDLLDSKWKGKIAIPDPSLHASTVQWFFSIKRMFESEMEWEEWIKDLGQNDPTLVKSFSPAAEMVMKGEKPIALTYIQKVFLFNEAPLDYVRISPSLANMRALALGAKAPHPNAAKLFINFMLSSDVAKILASTGECVTLPGIHPPIEDIDKIEVILMDELSTDDYKNWSQTFSDWLTKT